MKPAREEDAVAARHGQPLDETEDCPERPSSERPSELGFVRKPMVRWLDPHRLIDTSVRVVLSGIFGAYADKRELQALAPGDVFDRSGDTETWLDYVADLGDGWDATYSIARLVAAEKLEPELNGDAHVTERGRLLIMGGDEVYPAAKRDEYENGLIGPYRAALPCSHDQHPELFAIPGSHDWYDGLINFMRIFCRQSWIGGWRTRQNRSYFAVQLPHRWWLWGIDIQFDSFIDDAQLTYFSEVARDHIHEGDRIVLCTAKPAWVGTSEGSGEAYSTRNLDYFEQTVVRPSGAKVVVYLASGLHHYCRYEEENGPRQRITAGGGGAFLYPTHHLSENLELTEGSGAVGYRRAATYPTPAESKRLRKRLWLVPFRNLPFTALLAVVHVFLALMLGLHLPGAHTSLGLDHLWRGLWGSPTAVLMLVLIVATVGAMVALAHHLRGVPRLVMGVVHSLLQLAEVAAVMIVASYLSTGLGLRGSASLLSFLTLVALLGGVGSSLGLAGYLWATNCLGFHANEAYATLRIADFKHFLRLHIDSDGALTIFPIGVDRVCRKWTLAPDAPPDAPWFEPADGEVKPRLIEAPIRIS